MITLLLLVALSASDATAQKPAIERLQVELVPCTESAVVRTSWFSERRSTLRTTTNGTPMPEYTTHDERRIDRAIEVLHCNEGVPQKLLVRYGEAYDKRLDQDPMPNGDEVVVGASTYTTDRSPFAGRTFEIEQRGEIAAVLLPGGSPATTSLARLVLDAESVEGGAVPLPGDDIARAIGAEPRVKGASFVFDPLVARELLDGEETAECVATFTFTGIERTPEGRSRARFEARILVHEAPEGGLVRDADLRGTLLTEPRSGRPIAFEVEGEERRLGAASDQNNATEIEATGTWRVERTWAWR